MKTTSYIVSISISLLVLFGIQSFIQLAGIGATDFSNFGVFNWIIQILLISLVTSIAYRSAYCHNEDN